MPRSDAATPQAWLDALPPEQRAPLAAILDLVRSAIAPGFSEEMGFGMITWVVPLATCPRTYNGLPLMYGALAASKRHLAFYLMPLYVGAPLDEATFRSRWRGGRKLDLGKSCVRFRALEDLDLDLLREVIGSHTPEEFVQAAQAARTRGG